MIQRDGISSHPGSKRFGKIWGVLMKTAGKN